MKKIAIIGAGAAGLICAATLLEHDTQVEIFLLEKNDGLGKKVIISGGGRCNVTTGLADIRQVLQRYPRGEKFLSSAMHQFPPPAVCAWFEGHGVPLKVETDLRVFPRSNNGKDIVHVFERLFQHPRIHVRLRTHVVRIDKHGSAFLIFLKGQPEPLAVDRAVLTTGGQAYRQTGSSGDGYAFATSLGHTLTPLAPSLNAFYTAETWPKELSGLSFARAALHVTDAPRLKSSGPFLFTHTGLSGPAVFALSSLVAFKAYDAAHPLAIAVDLFPDETPSDLERRVQDVIRLNAKKSFPNALAQLVPKSLAGIVCRECGLDEWQRAADLDKAQRLRCLGWLKNMPLHIIGRGAGDEFVTAGGIPLDEVDPSRMASKRCPGLFFAGEILDVDGFTGGFNLQAAWATGRLAGKTLMSTYSNQASDRRRSG